MDPLKPKLQPLDPTKTLASPDTFNIILENMNNTNKYTKELESTINCYKNSLK